MTDWIESAISSCELSEEAEGYVLGRGIPEPLVKELNICVWKAQETGCPDKEFHTNGVRGHRVDGWLCIPQYTPRGRIVGCEFRNLHKKEIRKYYMSSSNWAPIFGGMCGSVFSSISKGADVWIVEGIFDLCLQKCLPENSVALSMGGAKITPLQLKFLSRFVRKSATVHVCFDMDETGRNQSQGYIHPQSGKRVWGVVEKLERVGLNSRLVTYRGGKDPGEVWENGGVFALKKSFNF